MEITNETFKLILDKVDPLERDVALNKQDIEKETLHLKLIIYAM